MVPQEYNFEHVEVGWRSDIGHYKKLKDGTLFVQKEVAPGQYEWIEKVKQDA